MDTLVNPGRTTVVTDTATIEAPRRRHAPVDQAQTGELGQELVASALLMVAVLSSTGLVLGTLLGALWLFG